MYDREKAVQYLLKEIKNANIPIDKASYPNLAESFIELDFEYMSKDGLLEEDSKKFYDDDKAFSHIAKGLKNKFKLSSQRSEEVTEELMEIMEEFLDSEDLYDWQ